MIRRQLFSDEPEDHDDIYRICIDHDIDEDILDIKELIREMQAFIINMFDIQDPILKDMIIVIIALLIVLFIKV